MATVGKQPRSVSTKDANDFLANNGNVVIKVLEESSEWAWNAHRLSGIRFSRAQKGRFWCTWIYWNSVKISDLELTHRALIWNMNTTKFNVCAWMFVMLRACSWVTLIISENIKCSFYCKQMFRTNYVSVENVAKLSPTDQYLVVCCAGVTLSQIWRLFQKLQNQNRSTDAAISN